jgi:Resolvase, N terminal domain
MTAPSQLRTLKTKGASLKATEQPIDTGTAAGKAFLGMLGVFSEFETNLRRGRRLEGIAKAKAAAVGGRREGPRPEGRREGPVRDREGAWNRSRLCLSRLGLWDGCARSMNRWAADGVPAGAARGSTLQPELAMGDLSDFEGTEGAE